MKPPKDFCKIVRYVIIITIFFELILLAATPQKEVI